MIEEKLRATFNLVDEPWIPVVWRKPRPSNLVSLRTLFEEITRIEGLAGETPIVTGSLYRLLLAITHSALRGPSVDTWADLWESRDLAASVLPYLERFKARFDLFHPHTPFFQQANDLTQVNPVSPINLVPHLAYGATLFDHHVKTRPFTMLPDEGARWLVTLMYFGLGGVVPGKKGKKTVSAKDAPCARAILFFVQGENLFETLMFNLLPYPDQEVIGMASEPEDAPFWEHDDPFAERLPLGYLDYLTWPSRRVHLYPGYREGKLVVERFAVEPGLILPQAGDEGGLFHLDPMQHYRKNSKKGWQPMKFREDRALWRDSAAILELHRQEETRAPTSLMWLHILIDEALLPEEMIFRLMALGAATKPGQKLTYFYRREMLPLPARYLGKEGVKLVESLKVALQLAENTRDQLWGATNTLARFYLAPDADLGGEAQHEPKKEDKQALLQQWAVERDYWVNLAFPFYLLIERLPYGEEALREWKEDVRRVAREAFERVADSLGETPRALKAVIKARGQLEAGLKKVLGATVAQTALPVR